MRAVSAALIAGLVVRLVLFPTGALVAVGLPARLAAFGAGLGVFLALGRNLALGIGTGAALLVLIEALTGRP